MKLISHPVSFATGTRVFMLKGRHKDGIDSERTILRVSHDQARFFEILGDLAGTSRKDERIYVSAGERSVERASRLFKERILAASYDPDESDFYRHIEARWTSCLMAPVSQQQKIWLFDCDNEGERDLALIEYARVENKSDSAWEPYVYPTKSGHHIVVPPFDKSKLSPETASLLHDNAIMLWGY
jgi:hypothetical protein